MSFLLLWHKALKLDVCWVIYLFYTPPVFAAENCTCKIFVQSFCINLVKLSFSKRLGLQQLSFFFFFFLFWALLSSTNSIKGPKAMNWSFCKVSAMCLTPHLSYFTVVRALFLSKNYWKHISEPQQLQRLIMAIAVTATWRFFLKDFLTMREI